MSNIIYIDTHIHIDIRFIMMKTLINFMRKSSKIVLIRSSFSFLSFLKLRKEEKREEKRKLSIESENGNGRAKRLNVQQRRGFEHLL